MSSLGQNPSSIGKRISLKEYRKGTVVVVRWPFVLFDRARNWTLGLVSQKQERYH